MKRQLKRLISVSLYILIILLLTFCVKNWCLERTVVDGSSMEDTLKNGDSVLVDKLSYRFSDPSRADIIVFPRSSPSGSLYVKRIVGLPGETVSISDGIVFINGSPLKENYAKEPVLDPGEAREAVILGPDEYFVLGDNRNDSIDSRSSEIGKIRRKHITGKVFLRLTPASSFGRVR